MKTIVWPSLVLAITLTACGESGLARQSSASTVERVGNNEEAEKIEVPETKDVVREVSDEEAGRRLGQKWLVDDYAMCASEIMKLMGEAAQAGNEPLRRSFSNTFMLVGEARPYVDETPQGDMIKGAMRVYEAYRLQATHDEIDQRRKKCFKDLIAAKEA